MARCLPSSSSFSLPIYRRVDPPVQHAGSVQRFTSDGLFFGMALSVVFYPSFIIVIRKAARDVSSLSPGSFMALIALTFGASFPKSWDSWGFLLLPGSPVRIRVWPRPAGRAPLRNGQNADLISFKASSTCHFGSPLLMIRRIPGI